VYAFSKGASVDFNDYNLEVLDEITILNVLLNAPSGVAPSGNQEESPAEKALALKPRNTARDSCENDENKSTENSPSKTSPETKLPETRFFSGDWASLDSLLTEKERRKNINPSLLSF